MLSHFRILKLPKFDKIFLPACLFYPAHLFDTLEYVAMLLSAQIKQGEMSPKKCYIFLYLKGGQSCLLSKFFVASKSCIFLYTAMRLWLWSEAILWSKMLIFKRAFHKLRVLPNLCPPQNFWPLIRAFKWVTIKEFSSRGMKTTKDKS